MEYTNENEDWNRSAIMSRGHEIAQQMDETINYNDRLSEGLTQAWDEAKSEAQEPDVVVNVASSEWARPFCPRLSKGETNRQIARLHDLEVLGERVTTQEAVRRLQKPRGVQVEHKHERWFVSVDWRSEQLYNERVGTLKDAAQLCQNAAWPISERLDKLDEAARQLSESGPSYIDVDSTVARKARSEVMPSNRIGDEDTLFVFADADTGGIVHCAIEQSFAEARRDLKADGIYRDGLELWLSDEPDDVLFELEMGERAPDFGDDVHTLEDVLQRREPVQHTKSRSSTGVAMASTTAA